MKLHLRLALGCLALAATISAQKSALAPVAWRELGPAPIGSAYAGRISAIATSPTDPGRYFVAGADSGVWRTTDGGSTWTNLTDHLLTTAMGAIAMDPNDENTLYVGTGEANFANHSRYGLGVFKSIDGGDTWATLAESTFAGRAFSRIVVDPANSTRVFAAVTRAGGFPEMAAAKGHPDATGRRGVFLSTDSGKTWNPVSLPDLSATDIAIQSGPPGVILAGIGRIFGHASNGIYRSIDGGSNWTRIAAGLPTPANTGRISLAFSPSDPSRAYALVTDPCDSSGGSASTQGAYRSDNGGLTWTSIAVGSIQSTYGWYLSVVSVDPVDPNRVFMGGLTFRRSNNAGGSWTTVTPPHVDLHAAAWDAAGRLLVGDDGGIHRSANGGTTWDSLNAGLGTIQFYAGLSTHPSDDRVVLGGTQDNGTNQRTALGTTWTQVFGGDGGWTQIDAADPTRRFAEYQGTGNLYRSTSSGASFNFSGSGINTGDRNCFLPPYLIEAGNSNRMLYATHRLYRSTNGGSSWTAISADLSTGSGAIRCVAQAPSDPNVIYVATNDGNVQVSTNGGSVFTLRLTGRPGWPRVTREIYVHPNQPMTALLGTASYGTDQVQRTTDGGATWNALDQGLEDQPVNAVALLPASGARPELLFAGTDAGLLVSADQGDTWGPFGHGLPRAPIVDILLEPDRNRILVGTQGRGAWSAPLRSTGVPSGPPVER